VSGHPRGVRGLMAEERGPWPGGPSEESLCHAGERQSPSHGAQGISNGFLVFLPVLPFVPDPWPHCFWNVPGLSPCVRHLTIAGSCLAPLLFLGLPAAFFCTALKCCFWDLLFNCAMLASSSGLSWPVLPGLLFSLAPAVILIYHVPMFYSDFPFLT
jgi:hypothetical protein